MFRLLSYFRNPLNVWYAT